MRHFFVSLCLGTALLSGAGFGSAYAQQSSIAMQALASTISYQGLLAKDGIAIPDGEYTITVTLYHDAGRASSAWSGTYIVHTSNGVFNLLLGSGDYPLPAAAQLDGTLFVGVKIGEGAELPLTQLSSAISAMNVADNSITAKKMGTDYIGSISINGQRFSTRGGDVNIITGDGMLATVDEETNSIVLSATGSSSSLDGKGANSQNVNTSYIINEYGTSNIQTNATFNIDGSGAIGQSASGSHTFTVGTTGNAATSTFNGNVIVSGTHTLSVGGTSSFTGNAQYSDGLTVANAPLYSGDGSFLSSTTYIHAPTGTGTLLVLGSTSNGGLYPISQGTGSPSWDGSTIQNANVSGTSFGITDQLAGDVNGNYYENFVNGINGIPVTSNAPADGQVLNYSSTNGDIEWTSGAGSFIRNGNSLQPSSNFNISGNGYIGGDVGIGTTSPITQFDVAGKVPASYLGTVSTGSDPYSVYVSGRYAYTANESANTMQIFDVSNPASPVSIGSVGTSGHPYSIYVSGRYAYTANESTNTLQIFDVSNPAFPISVGSVGTGNSPYSVYVSGRYAYTANLSANTLQVFDVSNPTSPVSVGSVSTGVSSNPISVYVSGRYAYTADYNSNTLQIFDVSNPASPVSVGSVSTGSNPYSVYVSGRYAYTANQSANTLEIFDISNPASPVSVGSVATGSGPYNVYVSGRYAYTANIAANTVEIFDVSNPSSPVSVGSVSTGNGSFPSGVYVSGRYAYTANEGTSTLTAIDLGGAYSQSLEAGSTETGQLQVRNDVQAGGEIVTKGGVTANNGNFSGALGVGGPLKLTGLTGAGTSFLTIDGSGNVGSALTSGGVNYNVTSTQNTAIIGASNYLFDLSYASTAEAQNALGARITSANTSTGSNDNATALTLNATATSTGVATGLAVNVAGGSTQNAATFSGGNVGIGTTSPITQFDVAGKVPASYLGTVSTGSDPYSVYVSGRYAYTANESANTMQIFDVSNPASPVSIGSVGTSGHPYSIYVSGRYAYTANESTNTLQIFDVSNPAFPISVGSVGTGNSPYSVYVSGRYAYTANLSANTLQVFDVSNPTSPVSVGSVSTGVSSNPISVYVSGRYAYTADYNSNTLQIFDVSNPASPVSVGSVSTGSNPYSVYVSGRYAYTANQSANTLEIFDISNPASPVSVGSVATGSGPYNVYVSGRYAYTANIAANTVEIFDVSNPSSPVSVGSVSTGNGSFPSGVYVSGRYAYTANEGTSTLTAIDLGGAYSQSLEAGSTETGQLQVRNDVQVGGELNTRGGVTGTNATFSGSIAVDGYGTFGKDVNFTDATHNIDFAVVGAGTGNALSIIGEQGASTSSGGAVNITGGAGGSSSGSGGNVVIAGGPVTSGTVGNVTISGSSIDIEDPAMGGNHIYLNHNSNTGTVNIGNPGSTGSGNITLDVKTNNSISIGAGGSSEAVNIGTVTGFGNVAIGNSGTGTGTVTINSGASTGGAITLNGGIAWNVVDITYTSGNPSYTAQASDATIILEDLGSYGSNATLTWPASPVSGRVLYVISHNHEPYEWGTSSNYISVSGSTSTSLTNANAYVFQYYSGNWYQIR